MALGAVARPLGGGAHQAASASSANSTRQTHARPISTRTSLPSRSVRTSTSALPSPHSAALEPSAQFRGRQPHEKGSGGSRASQSAPAVAAASAATASSPVASATAHRPRRLQAPSAPPPRSPRLSSPKLQQKQQQHLPAWLGSAVRRAVLSLDEAPLLVVKVGDDDSDAPFSAAATTTSTSTSSSASSPSFVTHALPRAALSAPALWPAIAETVVVQEGKEPEALLLFHKIEEEEEVRGGEEVTSPYHSHHHLRLSDFAALERGGIATAELAGRVGDCCHGEAEGGGGAGPDGGEEPSFVDGDLRVLISPRHSSSPSLHSETRWGSSSGSFDASSSSDVAFYGVVVQTAKKKKRQEHQQRASFSSSPFESDSDGNASMAAGCFVLKTVRTRSSAAPGGCSCVYFSLTRVGRAGEPLSEQLRLSWLA